MFEQDRIDLGAPRIKPGKPHAPGRLLLISALPLPLAVLSTFLCLFAVGNQAPRDIAPGCSLALPGLVWSLAILGAMAAYVRTHWRETAARRLNLLVGGLMSLIAWPIWTLGPLPSINGLSLNPAATSSMRLDDLTTSTVSKSRRLYYWAHLRPISAERPIAAGRYLISQTISEALKARKGGEVEVRHATGLLGAEVILNID